MAEFVIVGSSGAFQLESQPNYSLRTTHEGGQTVFYSTSPRVSTTINDGSLTTGQVFTFTGRRFFITQSGTGTQGSSASLRLDNVPVIGETLSGEWVNVRSYGAKGDGVTDDTAAIQAAITGCSAAGGGLVYLPATGPSASYPFSSLTGASNVRLLGAGKGATTLAFTSTTGHVFDFSGVSYGGVSDCLVRSTTQKTAGDVFYLDQGSGSCVGNTFTGLRMSSPYRGWNLNNCTYTTIDDIQFTDFNASWPYHSGIHLSGTATSTFLTRLRGGTAAGIFAGGALVYINGGAVDTVEGGDWDLAGQSGTDMPGLRIDSGAWIRLSRLSLEAGSGSSLALYVTGGKGMTFNNLHLLGLRGIQIEGGTGIEFEGGEIVQCQQEAIRLVALAAIKHVNFSDLVISDVGQATTNTYNAIHATTGVNDFSIKGCRVVGNDLLSLANTYKNACQIDATNDRYVIQGNRFATGGTGGLLDNGGGATKSVTGNI